MKEKNLKNLINSKSSSELDKIIQTAADMQLLTTALKEVVTQEISEHLVAANVRDNGELVVICTSSAWVPAPIVTPTFTGMNFGLVISI